MLQSINPYSDELIKESGYGREISEFGIKEFVNIKTVYVK
jgi:acyl-CoA reductase-like NAD-dependent aldehyde dehydrogenase